MSNSYKILNIYQSKRIPDYLHADLYLPMVLCEKLGKFYVHLGQNLRYSWECKFCGEIMKKESITLSFLKNNIEHVNHGGDINYVCVPRDTELYHQGVKLNLTMKASYTLQHMVKRTVFYKPHTHDSIFNKIRTECIAGPDDTCQCYSALSTLAEIPDEEITCEICGGVFMRISSGGALTDAVFVDHMATHLTGQFTTCANLNS